LKILYNKGALKYKGKGVPLSLFPAETESILYQEKSNATSVAKKIKII
jgi:hypothetical protein